MNRLFLTLVAISAVLIKINAQCSVNNNCPAAGTTCPVGESDVAQGGFCNSAKGDDDCKAHCTKTYGAELIKSECSAPRANKEKECVCHLKCQNGGCWGDPHCWSWDGTLFGYQSLKKYYVFKTITKLTSFPEFEIIQANHPYGAGPMATLDTIDFVVPGWGQLVQVVVPKTSAQPFVLTVNNKTETIPFKFTKEKAHRVDSITIDFSDAAKAHLVISTSFGVIITMNNIGGAYSDVSINIPRHPELKNNTGGILGRWNDNPADDNLDAKGQPQVLTAEFSAAFGDSWLLPGEELPTQADLDAAKAHHDEHVRTFNKEHREHLKKMCLANVHHAEMEHCMRWLGRPAHLIDDCILDLSHIIEEEEQHNFLKALVSKFKHHCPHHKVEFTHHPRPKHIPNHTPIIRHDHHQCPSRHHRRPPPEHEGPEGRRGPHHHREGPEHEGPEHRGPHHREGPEHEGPEGHRGPHHHREGPEGPEGPEHRGPHHRGGEGPEHPGHHGPGHHEGPEHHRGHPFLPHHKWGPPKPEHKDKCFKVKEHFQKDGIKLLECLKFEQWFEEDKE